MRSRYLLNIFFKIFPRRNTQPPQSHTRQIIRTFASLTSFPRGKTKNKPTQWGALALAAAVTTGTSLYVINSQKPEKNLLIGTVSKTKEKSNAQDPFTAALNRHIQKYYGDLVLPQEVIEQLAMFQTSTIKTSESNVRMDGKEEDNLHIEIKRSLSRWNCLHLLLQGDQKAYQNFVAHQPEAEKLSYDSFKKLAALLSKEPEVTQALAASCFIAMSDKAKTLAKEKKANFSLDSEKFLSDTIVQCPEINPITALLSAKTKELLPFLYLPDTHGRHMLYTEGGNNMFATMKEKLATGKLTQKQYTAWLGRWLINIAGFRGHEDPQGSIYLTENTAKALFALNDELQLLRSNPQHDPLKGYLKTRAKWLGTSSLYLAHLGASMRLYTREDGKDLRAWFEGLPKARQNQEEQAYEKLRKRLETTPTYEVAVLDNLRSMGCSISETLNIHSKVSAKAALAYQEAIKQNRISSKTPLCFRDFAFKNNLQPVLESYRANGELPEIRIDEQGNVAQERVKPVYQPKGP